MRTADSKRFTVLCVDDESTGLYFRRLILEQHGYNVITATTAERALELFAANDVDLVITDHLLGRDAGESMAAEMKRLRPAVPVMLLTGDVELTTNHVADAVMSKTQPPHELLEKVKELITSRPKPLVQQFKPPEDGVPVLPAADEPETLKTLLAEVVESSDDAILSKTLDGTVTSWNRAAEATYGYKAREIVGKNVALLLPPDRPNEVREILAKLHRGERIVHFETKRLTKDGRILDVSISVSPIRDRYGRIVGASTIARDITQLRRAEQALRNNEKLAVAGRMAATVAHEINNPLEALSNIFYLLKHNPSLDETAKQFVQTGEEELRRVAQITRLTLGFHRDRQSTPSMVSIPDLIENVLALYNRKILSLGVQVEKRYGTKGVVFAVAGELRQVFSNLIVNAVEALGVRGSRLIIEVSDSHDRVGHEGIRVIIADNGPGIPRDSLRHLFEPFYTTKGDKGTGIGLWVSRGIIEKHKGSVRVKSTTNRFRPGTVFNVFIPKALDKPQELQRAS